MSNEVEKYIEASRLVCRNFFNSVFQPHLDNAVHNLNTIRKRFETFQIQVEKTIVDLERKLLQSIADFEEVNKHSKKMEFDIFSDYQKILAILKDIQDRVFKLEGK